MHGVAGSEEWGEYLRRRRRQSGLTQADLATMANVAIRSIHALEAGKETARIDILIKAAKALGLSLTLSSPTTSVALTPPRKAKRSTTANETTEAKPRKQTPQGWLAVRGSSTAWMTDDDGQIL